MWLRKWKQAQLTKFVFIRTEENFLPNRSIKWRTFCYVSRTNNIHILRSTVTLIVISFNNMYGKTILNILLKLLLLDLSPYSVCLPSVVRPFCTYFTIGGFYSSAHDNFVHSNNCDVNTISKLSSFCMPDFNVLHGNMQ